MRNLTGSQLTDWLKNRDIKKVAFTGMRPKSLPEYGYNKAKWSAMSDALYPVVGTLIAAGSDTFITGGAQGFDQTAFWTLHRWNGNNPSQRVNNEVYAPFKGQESQWVDDGLFGKKQYQFMLQSATAVHLLHDIVPNYKEATKYLFARNKAMVNSAGLVIVLAQVGADGSVHISKGTQHAHDYAKSLGRDILLFDPSGSVYCYEDDTSVSVAETVNTETVVDGIRYANGDLLTMPQAYPINGMYDGICVTTNGVVDANGNAVMGKGVAKAVKDAFPGIERVLGGLINQHGNRTMCLGTGTYNGVTFRIFSFPTKHHWQGCSDVTLISQSMMQLCEMLKKEQFKCENVYLPRPGCGNGGLNWDANVKVWLAPFLENSNIVIADKPVPTGAINEFRGKYAFLSNLYPCPVTVDGITFLCSEAAFQAQKLPAAQRNSFAMMDGSKAKREGRKVALSANWEEVKQQVMYSVVKAKFMQNPDLAARLLDTGEQTLIEGNTWNDTYWGVCNGQGQNVLGRTLMKIRAELRK